MWNNCCIDIKNITHYFNGKGDIFYEENIIYGYSYYCINYFIC